MPLVDSDSASTWSQLYSCQIDGETVGFDRKAKNQYFGQDHFRLKDALNIQPNQRVALIGAAFGWIAEDWIDAGIPHVVATDISKWIHENKHHQAIIPILNEDSLSEESRQNIRRTAGGSLDIAITEDVLPNLTDAECLDLAKNLRLLAPKVVHWISCVTPSSEGSSLNMKTIEQWKELLTPDLVIVRGTGEVI